MPGANLVLLLGSFDSKTRVVLADLRRRLVTEFRKEVLFVFVMDTLRMFYAGPYQILAEETKEDTYTLFIFLRGELFEVEDFEAKGTVEDLIVSYVEEHLGDEPVTEPPIMDKLAALSLASKATMLVKDQELTRGGELVELSYLSIKYSPDKIWFIARSNVPLSTMVKEVLTMLKIGFRTYSTEDELADEASRIVRYALR